MGFIRKHIKKKWENYKAERREDKAFSGMIRKKERAAYRRAYAKESEVQAEKTAKRRLDAKARGDTGVSGFAKRFYSRTQTAAKPRRVPRRKRRTKPISQKVVYMQAPSGAPRTPRKKKGTDEGSGLLLPF